MYLKLYNKKTAGVENGQKNTHRDCKYNFSFIPFDWLQRNIRF